MRFFEFSDAGIDKFIIILKNFIGRASSKKEPAKLNWASLSKVAADAGFEMGADYETFKSMYDGNPILQQLVKNFDADGVELAVPGTGKAGEKDSQSPVKKDQTSQDAVDKIAASAAPQQLTTTI